MASTLFRAAPPRAVNRVTQHSKAGGKALLLPITGGSMGQLKLTPQTNVLSLKVARALNGEAHRPSEAKANGHRPGLVEAGLPLTPQRLELIKAYAKSALRTAQAPSASQIAERFAPRPETAAAFGQPHPAPHAAPLAPFATLASGIRRLTAVLVVAALLPNLTLAAFWLRLFEPPWSHPVTLPHGDSRIEAMQHDIALPVLSAPTRLEAASGEDVLLPIALDGTDGVPAGSIIVVRGLPPGSTLSNGRRHGETDWALRPDEIGDLHLVTAGAGGSESMLTIELVAPNNGILADAATVLKIAPIPTAAIAAEAIDTEPAAATQLAHTPADGLQTTAVTDSPALPDDTASILEPVPLPTRRPSPSANDDGPTDWIRLSAYVNLRDAPSSTARVVSVVAKGAKLRIMSRKRGWVQVADPATSQSGWIYSGNVETIP